jgi:hypothetical protein
MKKNAPTGWNTHRKSSKRLPSAQLLIVECQAEKLNQQGLGLGAQVHAIVRKTFPQKSVEFVGTSTTSDLLQSLARLSVKYERFRLVFIVGHSNALGLYLTADKFSEWNVVGNWLTPFKPTVLLLAACQAGRFEAVGNLFTAIRSLREVYASPVSLYRDQSDPLVVLIMGLLQSSRLGDSEVKFLQLFNYLKNEGLILRWQRAETRSGRQLKGLAWNFASSLLNKRR